MTDENFDRENAFWYARHYGRMETVASAALGALEQAAKDLENVENEGAADICAWMLDQHAAFLRQFLSIKRDQR